MRSLGALRGPEKEGKYHLLYLLLIGLLEFSLDSHFYLLVIILPQLKQKATTNKHRVVTNSYRKLVLFIKDLGKDLPQWSMVS